MSYLAELILKPLPIPLALKEVWDFWLWSLWQLNYFPVLPVIDWFFQLDLKLRLLDEAAMLFTPFRLYGFILNDKEESLLLLELDSALFVEILLSANSLHLFSSVFYADIKCFQLSAPEVSFQFELTILETFWHPLVLPLSRLIFFVLKGMCLAASNEFLIPEF